MHILKAFLSAWTQACASPTAVKIVIPAGTYQMGAVDVKGPCKAPIEVQVDGTIQAPANPTDLKAAHQWFVVQYVNSFTLSGKKQEDKLKYINSFKWFPIVKDKFWISFIRNLYNAF